MAHHVYSAAILYAKGLFKEDQGQLNCHAIVAVFKAVKGSISPENVIISSEADIMLKRFIPGKTVITINNQSHYQACCKDDAC